MDIPQVGERSWMVREHDVEDDDIIGIALSPLKPGLAIDGFIGGIAGLAQDHSHGLAEAFGVFDDEDAHGR